MPYKKVAKEVSGDLKKAIWLAYMKRHLYKNNLHKIKRRYQNVPLCQLYTHVRKRPLEEIYIPQKINLCYVHPHDWSSGYRYKKEVVNSTDIIEYDRFLILGETGVGKTTFLNFCDFLSTKKNSRKKTLSIFFSLKWYIESQASLLDCILDLFPDKYKEIIEGELEKGNCTLLFDDLNEIKNSKKFFRDIHYMTEKYSENKYFIASRNTIDKDLPITLCNKHHFQCGELLKFGEDDDDKIDIKVFLENWLDTDAEKLWQTLKEQPLLMQSACNPLTLSIIVNLYDGGKTLKFPHERIELFDNYFKRIFEFSPAEIDLLKRIAFYCKKNNCKFQEKDLLKLYKPGKIEKSGGNFKALFKEIRTNKNVFHSAANNTYEFITPALLDYLVAVALNDVKRLSLAFNHLYDPNWEEVILFLFHLRKENINEIISPLLDKLEEDEKMQKVIVRFLKTLDRDEVLKELEKIVENRDDQIEKRTKAILLFGSFGMNDSFELLQKAARDENEKIREFAVKALGNINRIEIFDLLENILTSDDSEYVRQAALLTIVTLGWWLPLELIGNRMPGLLEIAKSDNSWFVTSVVDYVEQQINKIQKIRRKNGDVKGQ